MEMKKLKKVIKFLIIISILALLFCAVGTYAKDDDKKDNVNWNVTNGLKKTGENSTCITYEDGNYTFRIFSGNDNELSKCKKEFDKEEGTDIYKRFDVEASEMDNSYGIAGKSAMFYGEYVKIGDKKYWIEVQHSIISKGERNEVINALTETDLQKLRGYLTYFNEHNNATVIDI